MSASEHSAGEQGHAAHGHEAGAHAHPGPWTYILVGLILLILTIIEVAIVYIPALAGVLVPVLMVLMVIKFALVVMYFMHLKFDSPLLSGLFTAPLLVSVSIGLALMALFGAFVVTGQADAGGGVPPAPPTAGSGH